MRKEDKEIALTFLNELITKGLINSFPSNVFNWHRNNTFSHTFRIGCGLYKYVFIVDGFDFVIKTDRQENWHHGCTEELNNYKIAIKEDMKCFFPETDFLANIEGHQFYIQEKAEVDEIAVADSVYKYVSPYFDDEEIAREYVYDDEIEIEDIINSLFSKNEADKLLRWLNKYALDDIHEGNIGWLDDHAVIIDFS